MLIFDGSEAGSQDSAAGAAEGTAGIVRLSVNVLEDTALALKELSEARGESITDTVTHALHLAYFIESELDQGKILMLSDASRKKFWDIVTA